MMLVIAMWVVPKIRVLFWHPPPKNFGAVISCIVIKRGP